MSIFFGDVSISITLVSVILLFRFYLQNFILLGNAFNDIQYIHQFEPQLLFYEIEG